MILIKCCTSFSSLVILPPTITLIVNKFTINITQLLLVIKCYLLYWLILTNTTVSILLSAIYTTLDLYTVVLMNNKLYPLSRFIVIFQHQLLPFK